MLQGLVFSCTHLSLFHFSVSCLLNQLTAQQLTPRIHPQAVGRVVVCAWQATAAVWSGGGWGVASVTGFGHYKLTVLGEGQTPTVQLLILTRKHGSIYNINIRRKARRHHLLFSMINESI